MLTIWVLSCVTAKRAIMQAKREAEQDDFGQSSVGAVSWKHNEMAQVGDIGWGGAGTGTAYFPAWTLLEGYQAGLTSVQLHGSHSPWNWVSLALGFVASQDCSWEGDTKGLGRPKNLPPLHPWPQPAAGQTSARAHCWGPRWAPRGRESLLVLPHTKLLLNYSIVSVETNDQKKAHDQGFRTWPFKLYFTSCRFSTGTFSTLIASLFVPSHSCDIQGVVVALG